MHDTTVVAKETSPHIEPGSSEAATLTWDTTGELSGSYDLQVSVDLPGDTTPNDNTGALAVELFHSAFEGDDAPESCIEDVRVTVDAVRDIGGQQRDRRPITRLAKTCAPFTRSITTAAIRTLPPQSP